jgi:hypothetical protein
MEQRPDDASGKGAKEGHEGGVDVTDIGLDPHPPEGLGDAPSGSNGNVSLVR